MELNKKVSIDYDENYYQYTGTKKINGVTYFVDVSTLNLYQSDSRLYICTMNDQGYVSIKRILTICVLILAVAILIPGIIIHYFTEYFTSRVLILRKAMHQASNEDYDIRSFIQGEDEISEAFSDLEIMIQNIKKKDADMYEAQINKAELLNEQQVMEFKMLASQINPHFLYNTFNCIRGMALYHGEKEIADLTMALSSFFRYSVQGEETVTVREALENLQRYAQIIQYRFNGKHKVAVNASRDVYLIKIPKMLIQPLVENAVLHGLETKVGEGTVRVDVRQEGQGLVVRVKDDGCGISEEKQRELKWAMECFDREETIPDGGQGIGFLNVYRRRGFFTGRKRFSR